ncbi:MAG: FAD-dependent oxidoreductase, partial [Bacteroidota bacterium]
MEKITITINNKSIETVSGKTILEVVREHKLDNIPTLCHDDRIEPYGSCFLCVVEVQGLNRLVPSCATPVSNGMVITTDNGKIRESRKTALELLLSNHYADCVGPCMNNCPANVDAQGYVALIAQGRYEDALKLIKEKNPLPLSIGRVCVRDCELECRRKHIDEPVAINYLKRFVADIDDVKWHPPVKADNGKKVAIIGGGPSGLTCAYYLRKEGYGVKIFEKLPKLGGMLRYGIPEYRLPKDILDKEINWITGLGIEVETGVEMGKDFSTEQLLKEGYNSVYLAVGAHKASKMGLNDEDTIKNVFGGIDFLRELTMDGAPRLKGTVVIVGGGNTAIDAARTALRCGADKVKLVYRRTVKEMPAHHEEISAAQHEGVDMVFLTLPKSIISENGKLKGIECMRMELRDAGDGKRPRPVPVEGSEYIIDCDYLIGAIGQAVDTSFLEKDKSCTLSEWNTIEVKTETFETSIPGVFAGGDVVSGPFTAVSSIGHGRIAAEAIMSYLGTGKAVAKAKKFYSFKHKLTEIPVSEFSHFQKLDRKRMAELPAETRIHNFDEVELGLTEEQSGEETFRCLECGCSDYNECSLRKYADDFQIDISKYIGETRKYKVDTRHPFIALDSNKCINCGKCVRTCSGILKVSALGFVYRGFKAVVKPAMEKALSETNCIACGNCIDVCPTGAITEKFPFKVLGTLEKENHETVCNFCSIGCKVNFKVINNDILYAGNDTESVKNSLNRGYLCVKGRFGHRYLLNRDRINLPVIRNGKTEKNLGWTEAYSEAAGRIGDIVKKYGPDSVAIFASPKLSNEELYLLQKFGRKTIGTNNLYSFHYLLNESRPDEMDEITGITTSTASIQDIAGADVIVAINSNLNEENLVMEMSIKEAQKK